MLYYEKSYLHELKYNRDASNMGLSWILKILPDRCPRCGKPLIKDPKEAKIKVKPVV